MAERGEWPREGLVLGVLSFSFTKLSSLPSLQNRPPLCCFSVAWPLCFLSLFPVPLFWFSSPPSFQKLFPPFCSCVKGERGSSMRMGSRGHQARAACAAPLPALLPTPEGLGQRHAHGGMMSTLFRGFFLFIFYFCGDPKMGYNMLQCLIKVI